MKQQINLKKRKKRKKKPNEMNCVLLCKSLSLFDINHTIVIAREKRKTAGEREGRMNGEEERGETSEGGASARMRE